MAEQSLPKAKGPAQVRLNIPVTQVKPEGAPALTPTYVDGVPVLSLGEGRAVPEGIDVVGAQGREVPATRPSSRTILTSPSTAASSAPARRSSRGRGISFSGPPGRAAAEVTAVFEECSRRPPPCCRRRGS